MNTPGRDPSSADISAQITMALPGHDTALARLAFADFSGEVGSGTLASRHLALLPPEALELDLDDPQQRRFGDYELLEKIGQGGMGVVYRAHQHGLEREVALKLLAAGPWASNDFIARFKQEAQSAARMQHPNIVAIYEIGSRDYLNFFSMQLVRGPSLAQLLMKNGPYPALDAARLLRKLADALDYAHRLGVLHLDLKPANVLLDDRGEPLVADFGLARRLDESFAADLDEVSGTPSYMAPEQAQLKSHKLSPATDIYGLGAILYELLSGRPPFLGNTPQDTIARVVHDQVPSLRGQRNIPGDLEAICQKCLAKTPSDRYPNAHELAEDLGRFIDGRPVSVRQLNTLQRLGRWAHREPRLAAAVAASILALAIGLVASTLQWRRAEGNARIARTNLWAQRHETAHRLFEQQRHYETLPFLATNLREQTTAGDKDAEAFERRYLAIVQATTPALFDAFDVGAPIHVLAISPDARYLALGLQPYTVALYDLGSHRQLWRVKLAMHKGEALDGQLRRLRFTPDGRWLLVSRHWNMLQIRPGGLHEWRLALADGAQTHVPGEDRVSSETWSDDGQAVLLFDTDLRHYRLWQADGWKPLSPVAGDTPLDQFRPGWLLAPHAHFIAQYYQADGVRILDPASLRVRATITTGRADGRFMAWAASPDGRTLALGRDDGATLLVDADSGKTRELSANLSEQAYWISFSPDGKRLAVSENGGDFLVFSMPDGIPQYLVTRPTPVTGHQFECDGATDTCTALLMEWDKVTMWQAGGRTVDPNASLAGNPVQLAPEISHNAIVERFASAFDLRQRLLVTGAMDGSLKLWRLPASPLRDARAANQREDVLRFDGKHLVGVAGRQLWVQDAMTGALLSPRIVLRQPVGFAALDASGRDLVASSGHYLHVLDWRAGRDRIAPIELPATPTGLLLGADGHTAVVRWTLAGGMDAETSFLQAWDLRSGRPLGPGGSMPFYAAELSADGSRLLVPAEDGSRLYAISDLSRPLRRFPVPDAAHIVEHAVFDPVSGGVVQFVAAQDEVVNVLQRWSADGRLLHSQKILANAHSLLLRPTDGRIAILGDRGGSAAEYGASLLVGRDGSSQPVELPRPNATPGRAQALSADGRLLAQAFANGVLLIDMDSGQLIGSPLQVPTDISERIAQMAFAPDGGRLLVRTTYGRWLLWDLTPDTRDVAVVAATATQTAPAPGTAFVPPSPALRAAWRQRELAFASTNPKSAQAPPSAWSCTPPADAIPPRLPDTPARLLDLDAWFTAPLHRVGLSTQLLRRRRLGNLCVLPLGVQRLLGVDYDLRGVVELRGGPIVAGGPSSARGDRLTVDVAPGTYARLHVLGAITSNINNADGVVGQVRLRYRDGGFRDLPLRLGSAEEAIPGRDDGHTRLAWVGAYGESQIVAHGGASAALYAADLANPEPTRELAGLELRVTASILSEGNLSVVAITLDPVGSASQPASVNRGVPP